MVFTEGTLLLSADLTQLANYLNPDKKRNLPAKGITSVRSRVDKISTKSFIILTIKWSVMPLLILFCDHYNEYVEAEHISPQALPELAGFNETFAKFSRWDWNFGNTPQFTHSLDERFNWGGIELHLDVNKGNITEVKLFTDSLDPAPLELLEQRLMNLPYNNAAISNAINNLAIEYPHYNDLLMDVDNWLRKNTIN